MHNRAKCMVFFLLFVLTKLLVKKTEKYFKGMNDGGFYVLFFNKFRWLRLI